MSAGRDGGRVAGKVALITGAARGQGRSHAVRLAEEGADVVAVDTRSLPASVEYPGPEEGELEETGRLVRAAGGRALVRQADVRDLEALEAVVAEAAAELGPLDIVCVNAGICTVAPIAEMPAETWQDVVDVNLTGAFNTCKAAIPRMSDGGSIVLTSSTLGLRGGLNMVHYTSVKHGLVGMMRALVQEVSARMIRVNCVNPGNVRTMMIEGDYALRAFRPDLPEPTFADAEASFASINTMPMAAVDPEDVSNAVLFLASDEARYVTGATLPVDLGAAVK